MKKCEKIHCEGNKCPHPIIRAAQRFKTLEVGAILEVSVDNAALENEIKDWVETIGYEILGIEGDNIKKMIIKKTN